MQHHGPLRLFRSLVFTGAVVGLAAGGHVIGGGTLPAPIITLALTALLSLAASVTARTGMPGWMLLLLAGLVQQVLHLAFSVFSGSGGGLGSTGHGHGILTWQPQQLPGSSAAPDHTVELLLYAHTAAALLAVLLIAKWDAVTRLAVTAGNTAGNNART